MRGIRCDNDFHRVISNHHSRHAGWEASSLGIIAWSTVSLVGDAVLVDLLIFRCERGLLSPTFRLKGIIGRLAGYPRGPMNPPAHPLPLPVGIFCIIERLRAGQR